MSSTPRQFGDAWDGYARNVLPKDASDVQRTECRRAFYAGGIALFYKILASLGPGEEPTDADMAMLDAIKAEFEAYGEEIAELAKKESS